MDNWEKQINLGSLENLYSASKSVFCNGAIENAKHGEKEKQLLVMSSYNQRQPLEVIR
jgi:hypothetical protein